MKLGILTFYEVPNYGAMLQAYALWHYLEKRGHEVVFIDYAFGNTKQIPLWRCFYSRHFASLRKKLIWHYQFGITSFSDRFPQTRRFEDPDSLRADPPVCDGYVVGSDQMWNPKWCIPLLDTVFLDFAPAGTFRIAYASSFGQDTWGEVARDRLKLLLQRFTAISVREESGIGIVKDAAGVDAIALPDPTLLMPPDFYGRLLPNPELARRDGKLLFSYLLGEWMSGTSYEEDALRACVDALRVETIKTPFLRIPGLGGGLLGKFGIQRKESVEEWIADLKNSDFVLTNSFHGTVFSLIFHRPFLTLALLGHGSSMNDRIYSLLKSVRLLDRVITPEKIGGISALIQQPIDWESVDHALADGKKHADHFFDAISL